MRLPCATKQLRLGFDVIAGGPLGDSLIVSRRLPYIYLNNPKCACSTIKRSLWEAEYAFGMTDAVPGDPHDMTNSPFVRDGSRWEHSEREFVFTFVRNPFMRLLSAYLDKIVNNDPSVRGPFEKRHGLNRTSITFADFIRLVATETVEQMDQHWRPQTIVVGFGITPFDFIGSVEMLDEGLPYVLRRIFGRGMPIQTYAPHRTSAANMLQHYYGPEEKALAERLYEVDFVNFGYGTQLDHLQRVQRPSRASREPLRLWAAASRHLSQGDIKEAVAVLDRLRGKIPGLQVDKCLSDCYIALVDTHAQRPDERADYLRQAIAIVPDSPALWKLYGKALIALGQREQGLEALVQGASLLRKDRSKNHRLARLTRRLAFVRARRSHKEALGTLHLASTAGRPGRVTALGRMRRALRHVVDCGVIHIIATFAALARSCRGAMPTAPAAKARVAVRRRTG